jgi:hypothetical protein
MEARKFVIVILTLLVALPVFAYDDVTTHPELTEEAIKFYNFAYSNSIPVADSAAIKQGSTDEDRDMRSVYHFFDPIYDRGIYGYITSKQWANDLNVQAGDNIPSALAGTAVSLYSFSSDYTWDRAVYDYVHNDKKRGLQGLGHILHLIEDATVPDHTRNDDHTVYYKNILSRLDQTSPYEVYTTDPKEVGTIADKLIARGEKPVIYSSLEQYFYNLAKYSNGNFYSRDTILDKEYSYPHISEECIYENVLFGCSTDQYGKYKLVKIKKDVNIEKNTITLSYSIKDDKDLILSDYWSRLSVQAVQNAAGVIKLFFDAVEEEKRTGALAEKNKSWLAKVSGKVLAAVGLSKATTTLTRSESISNSLVKPGVTSENQTGTGSIEKLAETNEQIQAAYLAKKIQQLREQLYAVQMTLDPSADWPPPVSACE